MWLVPGLKILHRGLLAGSLWQEVLNPGCCIPLNAILVKLLHESVVGDFIESLVDVHDDGVYLTSLEGTLVELMHKLNKLRLTGQTSSEAMLVLVEDVVVI